MHLQYPFASCANLPSSSWLGKSNLLPWWRAYSVSELVFYNALIFLWLVQVSRLDVVILEINSQLVMQPSLDLRGEGPKIVSSGFRKASCKNLLPRGWRELPQWVVHWLSTYVELLQILPEERWIYSGVSPAELPTSFNGPSLVWDIHPGLQVILSLISHHLV